MAKKNTAINYDVKAVMERIASQTAKQNEISWMGQFMKDFKDSQYFVALALLCKDKERQLKQGRGTPTWSAEFMLGNIEAVQTIMDGIDYYIKLGEVIKAPKTDREEDLVVQGDE